MKLNNLLIKLFIIFSIFSVTVFARGEMGGMLKSGEKITIKPKNNHAFSITRTKGSSSSHASYNVMLTNHGDIIYEDKNLVDDIYLVFHDDILEGDRMKIEVNHGYFDYELTPLLKLPTIVKNVLEPEVLERAKKQKKTKKSTKKKLKKKKRVTPKELVVTAPVIKETRKEVVPDIETQISKVPQAYSDNTPDSPIQKTFFEKFTKIFKELVKSLSFTSLTSVQAATVQEVKNEKVLRKNDSKEILPHFDDEALKRAATKQESRFEESKKGIESPVSDSALRSSASLEQSAFSSPKIGLNENFDDIALQESAAISKKVFNGPKEIAIDSQLPSKVEETFSSLRSREPILFPEAFSKQTEQVPRFKSVAHVAVDSLPDLQTESTLAARVPHFSNAEPAQKPVTKAQPEQKIVSKEEREIQAPVNKYYEAPRERAPLSNDRTAAYPDTGYRDQYKSLDPRVSRVQEKPVRQRVIEDTRLPQNTKLASDDASEKLVITKIIDKKEPVADPFAGRVLGPMDDRVLGNGYNGAASSAKLGMRVTKNSRPVSAWVEVFKNGTKQRVKTFYTSKGRKTKKVKLPAGTYTLRATYRTRDTKQQKTIKNVHLKAGDNVNKSIAFHDGKLRVVARRGDAPLYVKVIAYKSGSHQRVSYDFSSRTSGVAVLSLSSGTYDIEVYDHKKNRVFDAVRIQAGKTNTINVDF